jgi:hypothetical protein
VAAVLDAGGHSREDRLWEAAVAELTSEGRIGDEQAAELLERHERIQAAERAQSRRIVLIELAGYVGAALSVTGIAAISSQVWGDVSDFAQILILAVLAVGFGSAAALVARFTPDGVAALMQPTQAPRRRLVGVLGVVTAGLTTATVALTLDQQLSTAGRDQWMWIAAAAGLAIAAAMARVAPGVVPTLAVGGFLPATTMLLLNAVGWLETVWVGPLAIVLLAVVAALVLVRVLEPLVLVEAVAVLAWLAASATLLSMDTGVDATQSEATAAVWIGRVGLAALIGVGVWRFTHGGSWPWAVGVAGGSAALIGLTFAEALGGAIAMTIAGVVLIVTSVLLLRTHRPGGQG